MSELIRGRTSSDIYTVSRLMSQSCQHGVERETCNLRRRRFIWFSAHQHIKMLIQVMTFVLFQCNLICFYLDCCWMTLQFFDFCSLPTNCSSWARHLTPGCSEGTVPAIDILQCALNNKLCWMTMTICNYKFPLAIMLPLSKHFQKGSFKLSVHYNIIVFIIML